MPVLRRHLDLAVVYKGRADVPYREGRTLASRHFTSLVQVDGLFFELESLGHDLGSCWRCVPDLGRYFKQIGGEVLLAVRGDPSHPLAPYLSALRSQRFVRLCEALAPVVGGRQPIVDLTHHVRDAGLTAYDVDAIVAADFLKSKGIDATPRGAPTGPPRQAARENPRMAGQHRCPISVAVDRRGAVGHDTEPRGRHLVCG